MPELMEFITDNPVVFAAVVALIVVQLGLMAWAVVDWVKRPADAMRGSRVMWIIVILFGEILGSLLYLTIGRRPASVSDVPGASSAERSRDAAAALYGPEGSGPGAS